MIVCRNIPIPIFEEKEPHLFRISQKCNGADFYILFKSKFSNNEITWKEKSVLLTRFLTRVPGLLRCLQKC
jgi:hypothetical protein